MSNQYFVGNPPNYNPPNLGQTGFQIGDRLANLPQQYFEGQQRRIQTAQEEPIIDPNTGQPATDPDAIFKQMASRPGGGKWVAGMLPYLYGQKVGDQNAQLIYDSIHGAGAYQRDFGAGGSGAGSPQPPQQQGPARGPSPPGGTAGPRSLDPQAVTRPTLSSAGTDNQGQETLRSVFTELGGGRDITPQLSQAARQLRINPDAPIQPQQKSAAYALWRQLQSARGGGAGPPGAANPSATPNGTTEGEGQTVNGAPFAPTSGASGAPAPPAGPTVAGSPGPIAGGGAAGGLPGSPKPPFAGGGTQPPTGPATVGPATAPVPTRGPATAGQATAPQVAGSPAPSIYGTGEEAAIQNLRVLAGSYRAAAARAAAIPGQQASAEQLGKYADAREQEANQREQALLQSQAGTRAAQTEETAGGPQARVAAAKVTAEKGAEYYDATFHRLQDTAAKLAQDTLPKVQLAQAALRNSNFGPMDLTRYRAYAAQFGATDPNEVVDEESFNKIMNGLLMDQISQLSANGAMGGRAGGGGRGTGPLLGIARGAMGGSTTTTATNARLLEILRRASQDQVTVAGMAQDYADAHGGHLDPGWDRQLAQHYQQQPLFSKQELADPRIIGAPTFASGAEALAKIGPNQPWRHATDGQLGITPAR